MNYQKKLALLLFPFFLTIFFLNSIGWDYQTKFFYILQQDEECNPQEDVDCYYNYDNDEKENACNTQYNECIESCNHFDEDCINSCEKQYIECIEK